MTSTNRAVACASLDPGALSAHSLRAGFVTLRPRPRASDRAIAHQTGHRSLATLVPYVRVYEAWDDNAAALNAIDDWSFTPTCQAGEFAPPPSRPPSRFPAGPTSTYGSTESCPDARS